MKFGRLDQSAFGLLTACRDGLNAGSSTQALVWRRIRRPCPSNWLPAVHRANGPALGLPLSYRPRSKPTASILQNYEVRSSVHRRAKAVDDRSRLLLSWMNKGRRLRLVYFPRFALPELETGPCPVVGSPSGLRCTEVNMSMYMSRRGSCWLIWSPIWLYPTSHGSVSP